MKRVLLSGLVGFVVLALWTFVANGVFRFANRVEMNRVPDESSVHAMLKETVVEPGAYVVNPQPVEGVGFPAGEPAFGVLYAGFGHEAAGRMVFKDLGVGLVGTMLAAVLLSMASTGVLSRYWRRALFVALIGTLLAVFGDVAQFGIGGYPARSALLLAGNTIVSWTLMGLAMACAMGSPRDLPDAA
jgi:hypothetical protein